MKKELSVYILSNPAHPGCVKTDRPSRQPSSRAAELSKNNSIPAPTPFVAQMSIAQIFTSEELHLMIEAMNGKSLPADFTGQHLPKFVANSMEKGLLHRCWMVNKETLNSKLANLSTSELSLLETWIQGFWNQFASLGDAAESSEKFIGYAIQDQKQDKRKIASVRKQLVAEVSGIIMSHNGKIQNGSDEIKGGK